MKLTKFASMTIVAVLALWASNAKAGEIGSPQFEKLNFALTALQQDLNSSQTSSNAFASTITAFRINNKDLLKFFGDGLQHQLACWRTTGAGRSSGDRNANTCEVRYFLSWTKPARTPFLMSAPG